MNNVKIFLASSFELKSDRDQFEIFISRKNKEWVAKGVFLELVIWEDTLECMEQNRLQDKYNEAIKSCDIFVLLFSTKVGQYTKEEFEIAFGHFQKTKKPIIFTYFKNIAIPVGQINREDQKTLWAFQDRLQSLEHLQTTYESINDLLLFFNKQLDKLASTGFIKFDLTTSTTASTPISPKSVPHALTIPPFKPELFLGRDEDLSTIKDKFFKQNTQLLLVSGEGGLGKTTLASEYYHAYQDEYKHVAWVFSEKNIRSALLSNLSQPLGVTYEESMSSQTRLDNLLIAMNSLPKPCLLVIDDSNDPGDLEENYLTLRRSTSFHILLTTRITKFHSAVSYPLQTLPKEKALEIFREYYPYHDPKEDDLFYQIREAVGGNTLVIEILAKNLAILNQNENSYTLSHLIEDIQKNGFLNASETETLETTYHADYKMKHVKPSEIISTMYDLSNLTVSETIILSIFAVLPPEKMEYKDIIAFVDPVIHPDSTLRSLSQKGWIEYNQESRTYKCNPVIQEIIKNRNSNLHEDCWYLISALNQKLEYDSKTGHTLHIRLADVSLLIRYGESIIRSLSLKSEEDIILCDRIGMYYKTTGDPSKTLHFFTLANQLANKVFREYPNREDYKSRLAESFKKLGDICFSMGDIAKALTNLQQFNEFEKELCEANPMEVGNQIELVISFGKLGHIYRSQGDLSKALEYYIQSNQAAKELYKSYPQDQKVIYSLAVSYQNLGSLYRIMGNLDSALACFSEFNQLEKELSKTYPKDAGYKYGLGVSYASIADIYKSIGILAEALRYYVQYNQINEELYEAYPEDVGYKTELAVSYQYLGIILEEQDDTAGALEYFLKFHRLEKELYAAFPLDVRHKNGLAISCEWIGDIYTAQNNIDKTLHYLTEFNQIEKELIEAYPGNVEYRNGFAYSNEKLGNFYKNLLKDQQKAISYFKLAEQIWTKLIKDAPGFEDFKKSLARIQKELEKT